MQGMSSERNARLFRKENTKWETKMITKQVRW